LRVDAITCLPTYSLQFSYFTLLTLLKSLQNVNPSTEGANKTDTIALRSETGRHHFTKPFSNAMDDMFKTLNWKGRGININGEYISHLRFADDIVIMAQTLQDLQLMLANFTVCIALWMNLDKTKVMFNEYVPPEPKRFAEPSSKLLKIYLAKANSCS
jgi:hypothetical protein